MKNVYLIALTAILCVSCGTLAPDGQYKGDKVLYDADILIAASYDSVHTFVTWEYNNRAALNPSVTKVADKLRVDFPKAFNAAYTLRDAYINNPSEGTRDSLQQVLNLLRAAMTEAITIMANNKDSAVTTVIK